MKIYLKNKKIYILDKMDEEENYEYNDIYENDDDSLNELEEDENNNFELVTYNDVITKIENVKKKTIPILTKFEKARIMGVRIQQLANGAKPRINIDKMKSLSDIVNNELNQRKIPFIIRRILPNGNYEDWKMEEFEKI